MGVWTGCGFRQLCALSVEHKQVLNLSDIFCHVSGGTQSQMLTRELNLHSPTLIGVGTKMAEVFSPFFSMEIKSGVEVFFSVYWFTSRNFAIEIVLCVLGVSSPVLLII